MAALAVLIHAGWGAVSPCAQLCDLCEGVYGSLPGEKAGHPSRVRAARRRYLAEVPDAFAARVQAALPFLLAARGGAGARFLAPSLLQATGAPGAATANEAAEHAAWMQALGRPQARPPMNVPVNASLSRCGLSLHVLPRLLRRLHAAGRPGWDSQLTRCSVRVG